MKSYRSVLKRFLFVLTLCVLVSSGTAYAARTKLVPMKKLQRYTYFRKFMSKKQLKKAYNKAKPIVKPLLGKKKADQLVGVAVGLRQLVDSGKVGYTMKKKHYNDPYGYLVKGYASCSGCTRTVGLCLNMLGIKYSHVHENKYCHQWARVKVGKTWWICDPYGLYCGPEPGKKKHPYLR